MGAAVGLAGEMRVSALARARDDIERDLAQSMADRLLAEGPGGPLDASVANFADLREKAATMCKRWINNTASEPSIVWGYGDPEKTPAPSAGSAVYIAWYQERMSEDLAELGAPRSPEQIAAAGLSTMRQEQELGSALVGMLDWNGSTPMPPWAAQSHFARNASTLDWHVDLAGAGRYWTAPTEMIARLAGPVDSLRAGFGFRDHKWSTHQWAMSSDMTAQFREGWKLMRQQAGFGSADAKPSYRERLASSIVNAIEFVDRVLPSAAARESPKLSAPDALREKLLSRQAARAEQSASPSPILPSLGP